MTRLPQAADITRPFGILATPPMAPESVRASQHGVAARQLKIEAAVARFRALRGQQGARQAALLGPVIPRPSSVPDVRIAQSASKLAASRKLAQQQMIGLRPAGIGISILGHEDDLTGL